MSLEVFNPLSLYYLQQIGIVPWIKKNDALDIRTSKLLLVTSTILTSEAQLFLNRIFRYLEIEESKVIFVNGQKDSWDQIKEARNNSIVLSFGFNPEEVHPIQAHTILEASSITQVLKSAALKKKLFLELYKLKVGWVKTQQVSEATSLRV